MTMALGDACRSWPIIAHEEYAVPHGQQAPSALRAQRPRSALAKVTDALLASHLSQGEPQGAIRAFPEYSPFISAESGVSGEIRR
jgi:hypothetical protein